MEGAFGYRFVPVAACVMCGHAEARVIGRRLNTHQGLRPRQRTAIATTVVRCRRCGLIYANPRPVTESLGEHYDRPPEDYWPEAYFDLGDDYFSEEMRVFRRLWTGSRTPRALDVGSGIGKAMVALDAHGFDAFGIEPSRPFRDRAIASGILPSRLRPVAVEDAEFEPHTFDFVTFSAVLEHLHDPASSLEHALGWVAPRGLVHVEVPSANWLIARCLNAFYRAQGLDYATNLSPMHPPYHLYEFTLAAFQAHGRQAGYEVAYHQILSCSTFLPQPLAKMATSVMDVTGTNMQLQVWLTRTT